MIIEYQYVRIYSLKYKGRGISMNSNDKDELDDELIKSMKKLANDLSISKEQVVIKG